MIAPRKPLAVAGIPVRSQAEATHSDMQVTHWAAVVTNAALNLPRFAERNLAAAVVIDACRCANTISGDRLRDVNQPDESISCVPANSQSTSKPLLYSSTEIYC